MERKKIRYNYSNMLKRNARGSLGSPLHAGIPSKESADR